MRRKKLLMMILTLALFAVLASPAPVRAATYTVTNTNDSGAGSLRAAILQANAHAGPDAIRFNIPGCGGVCTIHALSPLPALTDDGTTIDGYSQPDAAPATADSAAIIRVEINGAAAGASGIGLTITSAQNEIRGLAITDFGWDGIAIGTTDAISNVVAGNYLGVDPTGSAAGNGHSGVFIGLGAHRNTIGGEHPADRNVLSGNAWSGVELHGALTQLNLIAGNYIGVNPAGNAGVPNSLFGVRIYGAAAGNFVAVHNVISGNGRHGVAIVGENADHNTIQDNVIGLAADGLAILGNAAYGVGIENGAQSNTVARNVIAANDHGVVIQSAVDVAAETSGNSVVENAIGVAADGITPRGNAQSGVRIGYLSRRTTVGANLIAHNGSHGVHVDTPTAYSNAIWLNSIHDNGGRGIRLTNGANAGLTPPIIHTVNLGARVISGAACPGCVVQVFANPDDDGEGQTFVGQADAGPAGDFDVTFTSLTSGYLTATATDLDAVGGTSEFSAVTTVTFRVHLPLVVRNR